MKIAFVYPDHESLGIQSLMALVRQQGHSATLFLYSTGDNFQINEIIYPKDILRSSSRVQAASEICYNEIASKIVADEPDLIAFSCVTDNFEQQSLLAKSCKNLKPHLYNIFGGIHITSLPEEMIARPEIDIIAIGDAELSFIEFINAASKEDGFLLPTEPIKGIVTKKNGEIFGEFVEGELADLDNLPFPDKSIWRDYPGLEYMHTDYKLMTSRGCPYTCSYCCNNMLHKLRGGVKIRRRSVSNVIEELSLVKERYPNIQTVHFWDDCFTSDKNWLAEFAVEYKAKIAMPFQCLGIPQTITQDAVKLLAEMGCIGVQLGVQSISPSINKDVLFRPFDKERISSAIEQFSKYGIKTYVDHILAIPTDNLANQEAAIRFYNKHRPFRIHTLWLTYYPSTRITKIALNQGSLTNARLSEIVNGENCSASSMMSVSPSTDVSRAYLSAVFLLRYVPLLPKVLVSFLLFTKIYRLFPIYSYKLTTLLPNYIQDVGGWRSFTKLCLNDFRDYVSMKFSKRVLSDTDYPSGIIIIEATYGGNCQEYFDITHGNVTDIMKLKYDGRKSVKIKIDVNKIGDPAPGHSKDFMMTWRYAEDLTMKSYCSYIEPEADGKTIRIPTYKC